MLLFPFFGWGAEDGRTPDSQCAVVCLQAHLSPCGCTACFQSPFSWELGRQSPRPSKVGVSSLGSRHWRFQSSGWLQVCLVWLKNDLGTVRVLSGENTERTVSPKQMACEWVRKPVPQNAPSKNPVRSAPQGCTRSWTQVYRDHAE